MTFYDLLTKVKHLFVAHLEISEHSRWNIYGSTFSKSFENRFHNFEKQHLTIT